MPRKVAPQLTTTVGWPPAGDRQGRVRAGLSLADSCGKADDPHNLEGGALAARAGHISKKRRRTLDAGWDVAAQEAGNSQAHPVNLG